MKKANLDFSNLKGGSWSKARGDVSMLILPYLLIGITRPLFSEYYLIVMATIILSIIWGVIWENHDRFDKSKLPSLFQKVPSLSILFAVGMCLALYKNYALFGGTILLVATVVSYFSAVLAINRPE